MKGLVDTAFDGLDDDIKRALLPDDSGQASSIQTKQNIQNQQGVDANTPQTSFTAYQVQQGAVPGSSVIAPQIDILQNITSVYDTFIVPLANTLMDKLGQTAEDLFDLLAHGSFEDVKTVLFDVLDILITLIKNFLEALLELGKDFIKVLAGMLDGDLDIPIVGAIYETVTALFGEEESFSVINGLSFTTALTYGGTFNRARWP